MSTVNQAGDPLKVALCTREYPSEVYGGAGLHVEYLAKELSEHVELTVRCQGADLADRSGAPTVGSTREQ